MTPTLVVEHLTKTFEIGSRRNASLQSTLSSIFRAHRATRTTIDALKDVSFEVPEGSVVGVVGRNGSGKSTLLKVLSRIIHPTSGRVLIRGRVGSLLEVGTGFHPELTGRENIYLNGAVLGIRRSEIRRQFDEIVAFSEVERFIDTAVKYYSSGMYMRLAFAVAAHLDTDILLVDEVLAVGDMSFQKKCLGKMNAVAKQGRTILFVSHNMGAVNQLCSRALLLKDGRVMCYGPVHEVTAEYLKEGMRYGRQVEFPEDQSRPIHIGALQLVCPAKNDQEILDINDPIEVHVRYRVNEDIAATNLGITLSQNAIPVLASWDIDTLCEQFEMRKKGNYLARIKIPSQTLKAGLYSLSVEAGRTSIGVIETHPDALVFEIEELSEDTTRLSYHKSRPGMLRLPMPWKIETLGL